MTNKRFKVDYEVGVLDTLTDEIVTDCQGSADEIVDLLNSLYDENEQLKTYIDTIFEGNTHICKELDIENVQFYCEWGENYRFPTCTYQDCFDEENLVEVKEEIRECNDE